MKVSVIIPTCCGRKNEILSCINSLMKQINDIYEIIIPIDSDREILESVKRLSKRYKKIKYLYSESKRGRCKSKNEAAKIARGDILLFLDDDVIIKSSKYFKILVDDFSDTIVGAVGGREIKPKQMSHIKKLFREKVGIVNSLGEVYSNFYVDTGKKRPTLALPGCNFAVRKKVFFLAGGFDENYDIGTAYREETDLQIRIHRKGYQLIFDPRLQVVHFEKESITGLKKWFKWYYVTNTYFFLKNFGKNPLVLFLFVFKEFLGALIRTLIYKKPYPIIYFPRILEGIKYYDSKLRK